MAAEDPLEITPEELAALRLRQPDLAVLDVREPWEFAICALADSHPIPMGEVPAHLDSLPPGAPLVVVCHHGGRSLQVARWLRAQGVARAVSLAGGIDLWARTIDPSLPRY